jgi:hypothetical protein
VRFGRGVDLGQGTFDNDLASSTSVWHHPEASLNAHEHDAKNAATARGSQLANIAL